MEYDIYIVRAKAFLYQLASLIGGVLLTAILGVFSGPQFEALVNEHFGGTIIGAIILMVVSNVVAHIRNVLVVSKAEKLGATGEYRKVTLI